MAARWLASAVRRALMVRAKSNQPMTDTQLVTTGAQLIPSCDAAALVAQRNAILQKFDRLSALAEDMKHVDANWLPEPQVRMRGSYELRLPFDDKGRDRERLRRDVDAAFWRCAMEKTQMLTLMSAEAKEKWNKQTEGRSYHHSGESDTLPEFTVENIAATFGALFAKREELAVEGVVSMFRRLSWDYKTNRPRKFGRRLIVSRVHSTYYTTHGGDELADLERLLRRRAGLTEPDYAGSWPSLIRDAMREGKRELTGRFFRVKWFANGNGHVTFTDTAAIDELNRIVAKAFPNILPPAGEE